VLPKGTRAVAVLLCDGPNAEVEQDVPGCIFVIDNYGSALVVAVG
jgi:hypothetical protein